MYSHNQITKQKRSPRFSENPLQTLDSIRFFDPKKQFQLVKQRQNICASEILDSHYFSAMLDVYQLHQRAIPNPLEIISSIKLLQKKIIQFSTDKKKENIKDKDKKYSEHSIITRDASIVNIKDDQTTNIKSKISKFLKDHHISLNWKSEMTNYYEIIEQFLITLQDFFSFALSNNKITQNIGQSNQEFQARVEILQTLQLQKKILTNQIQKLNLALQQSRGSIMNQQQTINKQMEKIRKFEAGKNRIKFLELEFQALKNKLMTHSSEPVIKSKDQIKQDSKALKDYQLLQLDNFWKSLESINMKEFKEKFDKKMNNLVNQNNFLKQKNWELQQIVEQHKKSGEKIAGEWKQYLLKMTDQYESEIQKLKLSLKKANDQIITYQKQLNRANSLSNQSRKNSLSK